MAKTTKVDGRALTIRWNNRTGTSLCIVCPGIADRLEGPELFLRVREQGVFPVCHKCGERLNPALMLILREMRSDPGWPHHAYLAGHATSPCPAAPKDA